MALEFTLELFSMMSSVLTELLCNDSTNEDQLFLNAAISESINSSERKEDKTPAQEDEKIEKRSEKRSMKEKKYLEVSRFEHYVEPKFHHVELDNMCPTTLKGTSGDCHCKKHRIMETMTHGSFLIMQKGGNHIADIDFKTHWRLARSTVELVYSLINSSAHSSNVAPMELLMVLWHLVSDEPINALVLRFSVKIDSVEQTRLTIIERLCGLRDTYERWPVSEAVINAIDAGFQEKNGLPRTMGVVSAVHLPCKKPPLPRKFFTNAANETTVAFQVACDHRGSFTYSSYFFWPGGRPEAEIYRLSKMNSLPVPESSHLVGNSNYVKSKNVVTPFIHKQGNDVDTRRRYQKFNKLHATTMQVLNDAVYSMVSRFTHLLQMPMLHSSHVRQVFGACLILHNICVDEEDFFEIAPEVSGHRLILTPIDVDDVVSNSVSTRKRSLLCDEVVGTASTKRIKTM